MNKHKHKKVIRYSIVLNHIFQVFEMSKKVREIKNTKSKHEQKKKNEMINS